MARRPRCPVCRSRRWHRDGLSGAIVCEDGHLLAGYVNETTDAHEGPSQHTQTTRRLKKQRRRRPERPPAHDHFHGHRDRFLVAQALQLVLREQLRVLIDELGFPAELEPVARDLWSLLVAAAADRAAPPAPREYHLDDEPAASYSGPRPGDRYTRAGRKPYRTQKGGTKRERRGQSSSDEADEDEHGDGDGDNDAGGEEAAQQRGRRRSARLNPGGAAATEGEHDPGGADPAAATATAGDDHDEHAGSDEESDAESYFSEDQDADDERPSQRRTADKQDVGGQAPPSQQPLRFPVHKRRRTVPPAPHSADVHDELRPEHTLLVIYLACITLRLPIMLADLFRLADTYQILYLDAVIHLPAEIQAHLPKHSRDLLSPSSTPHLYSHNSSLERLSTDDAGTAQATLARLVEMYREDWGVEFPEVNAPLLLARICRGWLALPPKACDLTLALLSHLPSPPSFYLPASLQLPRPGGREGRDGRAERTEAAWPRHLAGSQDWRVALPEVRLASVVVVLCRLLWDLEDAGGDQDEGANGDRGQGEVRGGSGVDGARDERRRGWERSRIKDDPMEPGVKLTPRPPRLRPVLCIIPFCSSPTRGRRSGLLNGVLPARDAWLETVERLARLDRPGDPTPLWTQEVVDMREEEVDAYLDFFESKIVSREKIPSRMEAVSRYFPEPLAEDVPSVNPVTPEIFLHRADELLRDLTSILPTGSETRRRAPFSPSDLPRPLSRLLTILASHLTPLPTSLHINMRGAAPSDASTGVANLLPFIDQVERALVGGAANVPPSNVDVVANTTGIVTHDDRVRRESLKEVKRHAETDRRERTKRERKRRREADSLRGLDAELERESELEDGSGARQQDATGTGPRVSVRVEDAHGRRIEVRFRSEKVGGQAFKSKAVISSSDDEAEGGDAMVE
ncbi:hypothetical protein JCM8202v2_004527 [Rhodotorula sphaerocarpa]